MPKLIPKAWGPPMWHTFHSIAYSYVPNEINKASYFSFFKSAGDALPCDKCKVHYKEIFNDESLHAALNSRDLLFKWVYDLHSSVNVKLGVKKWPTIEEVEDLYKKYSIESCSSDLCGVSDSENQGVYVIDREDYRSKRSAFIISMIISVLLTIIFIYFLYTMKWNSHPKEVSVGV